DHWVVQEKKGRKTFSRGVWAPAATIDRIRTELEAERSTDGYAKRKEASARSRDKAPLDGAAFAIGGLTGQPVKNYLKTEWLGGLQANPNAYHFASWAEGPIEPRFPWKKRTEWLSNNLPWPPPGRHVRLTFTPPAAPVPAAGAVMFEEAFATSLDAGWRITASKSHPRASFANEGKAGEIFALPDTCVFAERAWPMGAVSAEVTVSASDDTRSNSWGPGLALIADERVVSLVARPNSGEYEISDSEKGERLIGKFERAKPAVLRASLKDGRVVFEASQDGGKSFTRLGQAAMPGPPMALRVGKVGKHGRGKDLPNPKGDPIRCRVEHVVLRAAEPRRASVPRPDLPSIEVHYEVYDGLPLFSKWLVIRNTTAKAVWVTTFVAEELRLAEPESSVDDPPDQERPNLLVETDYAFGAMNAAHAVRHSVALESDPDYPTQVHYGRKTPCLLRTRPPLGPDQEVAPGAVFETFRTFELLFDSTERERRGLAQRRMYRTLAPW